MYTILEWQIAQELDYVNHHVRSKLDEIKRRELERLRSLANQKFEMENDIDRDHLKISQHLDHGNEHTFEIEDLKKLIKKTAEDLAEADRKRQAEFKEYEMQKEFEKANGEE
ncbi:Nucleobindin-1 [Eumeta japonica]|uniref:Nucleobindin-1 n=1 Tax=Eumeta variegata TaxID=151549 RepID=A0A4C1TEB8_EUMVA|nr:Nucleobindin-1 [Eumeta japonica]